MPPSEAKAKVIPTGYAKSLQLLKNDDPEVIGVPLSQLLETPGSRLPWAQHTDKRKILFAHASREYISNPTDLTAETINKIMTELELTYLDKYTNASGKNAFDQVVEKIMNFYSYQLPKFLPYQEYTKQWYSSDWDGNTDKPEIADPTLRKMPHREPIKTSKAAWTRQILSEARKMREKREETPASHMDEVIETVEQDQTVVFAAKVRHEPKSRSHGVVKKAVPAAVKKIAPVAKKDVAIAIKAATPVVLQEPTPAPSTKGRRTQSATPEAKGSRERFEELDAAVSTLGPVMRKTVHGQALYKSFLRARAKLNLGQAYLLVESMRLLAEGSSDEEDGDDGDDEDDENKENVQTDETDEDDEYSE
ncbi:hypothetical protein C1H76_2698 [Elsinoe australis]|uniref:Uncharacterized protein n=1 Tax=Elsinoe australis TaxID=40998 RepID=A0A4V6DUK8_9PEZI|nr:hypothetical protein C1H76_2698 [Elsinoe australis]